jgi:hypothetical protein
VHARPARLLQNDAALLWYGYYGIQEATTVGHRCMVVQGTLIRSDRVLLIFVVV